MAVLLERLSYARSILITAPLVFITTAVMGTLSLLSSLFDSSGTAQHACARWWARMVLAICRVRLTVSGHVEFRENTPCVFFANHQSHIDIPVVLAALPIPFRFAAKKELFRIPFLGWHLRRSGHIAVDRQNPHASVKSFRGATRKLSSGTSLVFFPEGATSLDGRIKSFKSGGFVLARQSQADVVALTIRGTRAVLKPRTYHVKGGPVEVTFGHPVSSTGYPLRELVTVIHEDITTVFENDKTLDRNTHSISR
ncbi:MAG TPA: lysophospholipid acyltransferase family protein [Terriglobia bacterium]|nr:lysophospholipid acyltransferase family protein [Terriglobia bacterium]